MRTRTVRAVLCFLGAAMVLVAQSPQEAEVRGLMSSF